MVSVPFGSAADRSRSGETITHTRSAPASRAARTGQATIGRPHTGCSIFGTDESMRVPSPAAMIRTVGPLTFGIVERITGLIDAERTSFASNVDLVGLRPTNSTFDEGAGWGGM